ncbi:ABC transporter permease [Prosthecodimorpha staleyi]|uniref:ABC transporter permease n=1 Tax=Prosthecodimorpha staleyi TaxID=2840188 RepID=A0A947GDW4_9HYPH|nr:ABC transporter permease [Prosthecodimorpha staleyi]MBT9291242.1 ABC transporter permease [Prosthecodimorpha staleyi]
MRLAAILVLAGLVGTVAVGLAGTLLPAFGHLPAIGAHGPSLDAWSRLFAMPGLARSAATALALGIAAAALSLAIVLLVLAAFHGTRPFRLFVRLIGPLLSIPHAAAAFGLAFLLAPSGWFLRLLSPWATGFDRPPDFTLVNDPLGLALLAGLVAKEVPFLMLVALAVLPQTAPAQAMEVAAGFGYGRMKGFLVAVGPRLLPRIRLPLLAVAAYASGSVDMALILGPTGPPPLPVRVLRWFAEPDLTMRTIAAAGTVLQALVTGIVALAVLALEAAVRRRLAAAAISGRRRVEDRAARIAAGALACLPIAAIGLGAAALALWSVATAWRFPAAWPEGWSLATWTGLAPALAGPILTSAGLGLAAAAIALLAAIVLLAGAPPGSRASGPVAVLLFLPILVPETSWLFGLDVALSAAGLTPGPSTVLIGHVAQVVPYVHLSLAGPWAGLDRRLEPVAASLGAGPLRRLLAVRLPLLAGPLLTAAAVGFAVSIALYLPTLVLGGGRVATITTETLALAGGADRRITGATALVQALLPFAGFALTGLAVRALALRRRQPVSA